MADDRIGGIPFAQLAETARDLQAADEAGASLTTRFVRQVSDLVIARAAKGESSDFSVFLQSESLMADATQCGAKEAPLLRNAADLISGAVWLTTSSVSTAFKVDATWSDDGTLFQAVRNRDLGRLPALVIDWRQGPPIGTLYGRGLDEPLECESVIFEHTPIDSMTLKDALDRFYQRTLRTPGKIADGHGTRVWKNASKGVPLPRPEERIQGRLVDNLRGRFVRHHIRPEPPTDEGRADIIIWHNSVSKVGLPAIVNEWVLELKALCDKTCNEKKVPASKVKGAVKSGLQQVLDYKRDLNVVNGALCCYDMRSTDEGDGACFSHVSSAAKNDNIPLWRWFLFRRAAQSRESRALTRG